MNWEPRALHNKPTSNKHSKVIFIPIILPQKYFLQGPNCTHIQALVVLSRTYPPSDKNKNTIKLSCSECCISRAGQAALNAFVLGLNQVTNWPPKPCLGAAVTDTAALVLKQVSPAMLAALGMHILMILLVVHNIPRDLHPPLCRLVPCCASEAAGSALNHHLLWKTTLHRSGDQSDSCASTLQGNYETRIGAKSYWNGCPAHSHPSPQLQLPILSLSCQH